VRAVESSAPALNLFAGTKSDFEGSPQVTSAYTCEGPSVANHVSLYDCGAFAAISVRTDCTIWTHTSLAVLARRWRLKI
jgi:hypothetical protein